MQRQPALSQVRAAPLSQVLGGVVIMFSRIIPLDEEPTQHTLWLRATAFGATCTVEMSPAVTHLVTNTQHTLKVACCVAHCRSVVLIVCPGWFCELLDCNRTRGPPMGSSCHTGAMGAGKRQVHRQRGLVRVQCLCSTPVI